MEIGSILVLESSWLRTAPSCWRDFPGSFPSNCSAVIAYKIEISPKLEGTFVATRGERLIGSRRRRGQDTKVEVKTRHRPSTHALFPEQDIVNIFFICCQVLRLRFGPSRVDLRRHRCVFLIVEVAQPPKLRPRANFTSDQLRRRDCWTTEPRPVEQRKVSNSPSSRTFSVFAAFSRLFRDFLRIGTSVSLSFTSTRPSGAHQKNHVQSLCQTRLELLQILACY